MDCGLWNMDCGLCPSFIMSERGGGGGGGVEVDSLGTNKLTYIAL